MARGTRMLTSAPVYFTLYPFRGQKPKNIQRAPPPGFGVRPQRQGGGLQELLSPRASESAAGRVSCPPPPPWSGEYQGHSHCQSPCPHPTPGSLASFQAGLGRRWCCTCSAAPQSGEERRGPRACSCCREDRLPERTLPTSLPRRRLEVRWAPPRSPPSPGSEPQAAQECRGLEGRDSLPLPPGSYQPSNCQPRRKEGAGRAGHGARSVPVLAVC